ncbi:MAG: Spy/CpxP family protein refolding chaperone, partial [Bacteroidales bacterium]|nr:Spy/CpxP family protein refolding chaperone [Bacteroidales bacterium]
MKKVKFKTLALLLFAALLSINTSVFAQKGNMQMMNTKNCNIPNLTEEQETKIEKLRTAHMQEMINFKTQFAEKKAHKNTLMTAKTVDLKAVNKVVDEMSSMKAQTQKSNAKHHNDVRNLLTDEQKVFFNNHYLNKRG